MQIFLNFFQCPTTIQPWLQLNRLRTNTPTHKLSILGGCAALEEATTLWVASPWCHRDSGGGSDAELAQSTSDSASSRANSLQALEPGRFVGVVGAAVVAWVSLVAASRPQFVTPYPSSPAPQLRFKHVPPHRVRANLRVRIAGSCSPARRVMGSGRKSPHYRITRAETCCQRDSKPR